MTTPELQTLRESIDAIDQQILKLLAERIRLVLTVGDIKRRDGVVVYDPDRERVVLERLTQLADAPLDAETVTRIFESVIRESRRLEEVHVARS